MVIIRFHDSDHERRGLGFLLGRYSFKSWDTGETMVPEEALAALAHERIKYSVEGPSRYEHHAPAVRSPAAKAV